MMSWSSLNGELVKIAEQGRLGFKLEMVALNHIKHKLTGSNASPLITKGGSVTTCTTDEDEVMKLYTGKHQECHPSQLPFLLELVTLADAPPPNDFLTL